MKGVHRVRIKVLAGGSGENQFCFLLQLLEAAIILWLMALFHLQAINGLSGLYYLSGSFSSVSLPLIMTHVITWGPHGESEITSLSQLQLNP